MRLRRRKNVCRSRNLGKLRSRNGYRQRKMEGVEAIIPATGAAALWLGIGATRAAGEAAYLFAALCCVWAWSRASGRRRRLPALLTLVELALLFDMLSNGRWALHDLLGAAARDRSLYGERVLPQIAALALLGLAAAIALPTLLRTFRGRPGAALAVTGAVLSLACWCVEVVSLHAVDALLYRAAGGLMFVAPVWIASGLLCGLGMLWDARTPRGGAKA